MALLLCQCMQPQKDAPALNAQAPHTAYTARNNRDDFIYMPTGLCYLDEIIPGICVDLKYCGSDNFVGRPICGYTSGRRAILRRDTAEKVARAQQILACQGLALKVWDAYRPHRAMKDFLAWSHTADESKKAEFYPHITKQGIYEHKYISRKSDHSCGLAVDVTLIRLETGEELDMGGRHDLLDESSATRYSGLTPEQQKNRLLLARTMAEVGLRNYRKEWWHYSQKREPDCKRYDFPLNDNLKPAP
jgi:D-alanyl-D-alanine dipeptidase